MNKDGEGKFILPETTLEKNKLVVAHYKKTSKVLKEISYQCSECELKLSQRSHLTRRLWSVHQIGDGVELQCSECDKKFKLNAHLKRLTWLATRERLSSALTSSQNILTQLRKTCYHPYLFHDFEPKTDTEASRIVENMRMLVQLLIKMKNQGLRALISSQMTGMHEINGEYSHGKISHIVYSTVA